MSGTEIRYGATSGIHSVAAGERAFMIRDSNAMSGTDRAYGLLSCYAPTMRCPVCCASCLRACYAMSGTHLACAATRVLLRAYAAMRSARMLLRSHYAMCGTDTADTAPALPAPTPSNPPSRSLPTPVRPTTLRACYALSSTETGYYLTCCPVLTWAAPYASAIRCPERR
eukprot:125660-Rhodomonas_salina.8